MRNPLNSIINQCAIMESLAYQFNNIIDEVKTLILEDQKSDLLDVYNEFKEFGLEVDVYDCEADFEEVKKEFGINLIQEIKQTYDGVLLAVSHESFSMIDINSLKKNSNSIVFDLKGFLPRDQVNSRL